MFVHLWHITLAHFDKITEIFDDQANLNSKASESDIVLPRS